MERTKNVLDLARAPRELRVEPVVEQGAVLAPHSDQSVEPIRNDVQFGDTLIFKSPVIQLDPAQRERERILAPGAPGVLGAPYKMLRTQVLKRLDKLGANTLAVMSASASDGKTLTAINLAIAIAAESDRTALLVDLDLRNPSIHRRFGFTPEVGIESCLASRQPVQEAMVKIAGYERLTLMPARERVDDSSEILGAQKTVGIIHEMRMRYANRILIFDLPPVLHADDALAFSKLVQAGLIVVGERHTRRDDVTRTLQLLSDLPIVGTVLNGSRSDARSYY